MIAGFMYVPGFVSADEEEALLSHLTSERYAPLAMRGQRTRRSLVSYGLEFQPHVGTLDVAPVLPEYLHSIRARAATFVGISAEVFEQSLLTKYPAGSDIGWHIDHQNFGNVVVAISLLGDATLAFRCGRDVHRCRIAKRSLYILRDAARFEYQHKVTARELRYSITLRPIAPNAKRAG